MATFNYDTSWTPGDAGKAFDSAYNRQETIQGNQQAAAQKQQLQALTQAYLGGDASALNQIAAIAPATAKQLQGIRQGQQPALPDIKALGDDLTVVHSLAKGKSPMLAQMLGTMMQKYQGTGFDNEIMSWAQQYDQDPQSALSILEQQVSAFQSPDMKVEGDDVVKTDILFDGTTVQGLRGGGVRVTNPDGQRLTGSEARNAVKEARKQELDYQREQKELEVETARNKARAGKSVELEAQDISAGLDAAQGLPTLKRAEKLLTIVETGKPEQALNYANKVLGIQGADAAELENLLGKRILQQLKPIFGAQFTRAEGEWLREMESNFGTSREANLRLIRQGQMLLDQRANMGFEAATAAGDRRAANNIRDWMEFSLDPQESVERKAPKEKPIFSPALNSEVTEQQIQEIMSRGYTREEVMQKLGVN